MRKEGGDGLFEGEEAAIWEQGGEMDEGGEKGESDVEFIEVYSVSRQAPG
jgi:hypothetical protein